MKTNLNNEIKIFLKYSKHENSHVFCIANNFQKIPAVNTSLHDDRYFVSGELPDT